MIDLQESRRKIDRIDEQITALFEERMAICQDVAEYKIQTGKEVLDTQREREKLTALKTKAHTPFNQHGIEELFQQIMAVSRKRQYQLMTEHGIGGGYDYEMTEILPKKGKKVVFQGVEGAYSYAAMKRYFGEQNDSFHVETWKDAIEAVLEEKADYAVLPIENSTAGIVEDNYDLLAQHPVYIVGEQIIPCEHVLLGLPDAEIEEISRVYSHPQALAQCRKYLDEHPQWKQIKVENTAVAAKKIQEEKDCTSAAIASKEAAQFYGLKILKDKIYHNAQNSTRFIIISKHPVYEKKAERISICFELPHKTGSLYNMLSHIIYNGLNMTRIQSRPIVGRNWEYRFFLDFDGNLEESAVKNALRGIKQEANMLRILGNY